VQPLKAIPKLEVDRRKMAKQSSSCRVQQVAYAPVHRRRSNENRIAVCLLGGCSLFAVSAQIPRFQHVVVIFQENGSQGSKSFCVLHKRQLERT
jgi:hypothetical protein